MKRPRNYRRFVRSITHYTYLPLKKSCRNKIRYDSEVRAAEGIVNRFNADGKFLKHYKCPYCKGYHLTKKKANQNHLHQAKNLIKWGCEA
jgi:hypothetical protein